MIQLKNVRVAFGRKIILDNINLTIEDGECVAIIGPSGCGKSTLLKLLLGLIKPTKGEVIVDGQAIHDLSEEALSEVRMKFGFLFQSGALFDSMTIEENVAFPLLENTTLTTAQVKKKVKEKLNMVEMTGRENDMPSSLSGGQRKRIGLARAIAADPNIVLYDEPTTGLDPILSTNIEDLIVKLSEGQETTSIVVTHQLSTILRTSDRIYLIHEKGLLPPETPESVYTGQKEYQHFMRGGQSG